MPRWDEVTSDVTSITQQSEPEREETFSRDRPYLIVLTGSNVGEMYPLNDGDTVMGRGRHATIQLLDEGVSRQHAVIHASPDGHFHLRDLDSRNGTFLNGERTRHGSLGDGDKIQLGRSVMLRFGYQDRYDESFQRLMHDSALRDGLTQAFNRRYFLERLRSEYQFARRHSKPLSLLLMDLDHFKQLNDRYGHLAGDYALNVFARCVQHSIRNEDVLARYGGEEFAIISRAIMLEDASRVAERLRHAIEQLQIEYNGQRISLTVSVGTSGIPEVAANSAMDLIHTADLALYWAKTHGRNQVVRYRPEMSDLPKPH